MRDGESDRRQRGRAKGVQKREPDRQRDVKKESYCETERDIYKEALRGQTETLSVAD